MHGKDQRRTTPGPGPAWHALSAEAVLSECRASPDGLDGEEAARRLAAHGPNRLRPPKPRNPLLRFLVQFHNVLIYVLLAAGVVTTLLGHWVDAGVIFGVVVVNAIVGFIQEGKAEKALDAIRNMLSATATVVRDGQRIAIPATQVVPGDVVFLQSGDKVPADMRLLRVRSLQIQEAALTGESVPADKESVQVAVDAALGDRTCMAYSSTLVTYGQGSGVVVATGDGTEIGRISAMLGQVEALTTPLVRQMAVFSRWLTLAILVVAALTFLFGYAVRGYPAADMFLAAVGLAVAAIPEGLPAIMTITLAIGVQRMAARNAIVRRLPAVETLGSVSVICSDKTGTLTQNEMTAQAVATARHLFEVTGVGYAPTGSFLLDGIEVEPEHRQLLTRLAEGAALCSDAVIREKEGHWFVDGDPTEGALVTLALKAGVDMAALHRAWPRTDEIPFESEHRFMATLHHGADGGAIVLVKGAPERILTMCTWQRSYAEDEPLDLDYWQGRMQEIASRGQRLLALAVRNVHPDQRALVRDDLAEGLTLLGVFGLLDPPRQEAIAAVTRCQDAGIRIKMITGDHTGTAISIARNLGLVHTTAALSGSELEAMDDDTLRARVRDVDVFARASPEHKLRLVRAIQANGQVLAMTGDGVNDAPALKQADIGVAMGLKGTEAAKEAAEMVLADDNFATISHAVEEGRTVYDNLKKAIIFILPTNGGEALTIIAAILLGRVLPITAVQILWVNMITAVTLALALAFEPVEADVMKRHPRAPDEPLLSPFLTWRIVFVSLILVAGTFGLYVYERSGGAEVAAARTVAVNTLVFFEIFYLFNTRFLRGPVLNRRGLAGSRAVLAAVAIVIFFQLLFTYAPPMQVLFDTRPMDAVAWLWVVAVASTVLFAVEAEKWVLRRWAARAARRDPDL
ncbi:MAG: cation-transporting P-type ATPase [Hyphomicrobiales bacterium]|nr:cation-transporting P-type ATPase [Hyphomicrobiales bacterium]